MDANEKAARVHLVLVEGYPGPVYVDSAWTSSDGAAQRITDLRSSEKAFKLSHKLNLQTLEIRLDTMGVPIKIEVFNSPEHSEESPNATD